MQSQLPSRTSRAGLVGSADSADLPGDSVMLAGMEFQDVVRRRRMVRNYTDEPVDSEIVDRALRNATRAPSAGFSQGWGFLVLDTAGDVRRYWTATAERLEEPDEWLRGLMRAPVLVVPCSSKAAYLERYAEPDKGWTDRDETRWSMPFWHMDAAMAALLILQTAVDAGIGGCFIGIPADKTARVRGAFAIPDTFDPIGALTLGHPASRPGVLGSPVLRPRKQAIEVLHRGSWAPSPD